ncbi:Alpha/Beta hydrolase protein [Aspergillus cavernicola]|uniref:Alpha/Beta hydrolase protein n=1 Tax=Aspergillus cavernicola TaxID=176166 RepID=A0ABR4I906_9EURO
MPYQYDAELEPFFSAMQANRAQNPPPAIHDIATRRRGITGVIDLFAAIPLVDGVQRETFTTTTPDGHELVLVWYSPVAARGTTPGPALLQIHGGGFIAFNVHHFHHALNNLVAASQVPMLCVDYRIAPEHRYPVPLEDCYTALTWLRDHATELKVDLTRIGVTGDSAGGGLAAGLVLMARDREFSPPLAKQVLIYPMLDDRITIHDEELGKVLSFTYEDKITSWAAYLGQDVMGTEKVSKYAAPGRETDLSRLPSAYIDVGQLDAFTAEVVHYASGLVVSGVDTEFHLYPGAPHAFDVLVPEAAVSKRAREGWVRAFQSF